MCLVRFCHESGRLLVLKGPERRSGAFRSYSNTDPERINERHLVRSDRSECVMECTLCPSHTASQSAGGHTVHLWLVHAPAHATGQSMDNSGRAASAQLCRGLVCSADTYAQRRLCDWSRSTVCTSTCHQSLEQLDTSDERCIVTEYVHVCIIRDAIIITR